MDVGRVLHCWNAVGSQKERHGCRRLGLQSYIAGVLGLLRCCQRKRSRMALYTAPDVIRVLSWDLHEAIDLVPWMLHVFLIVRENKLVESWPSGKQVLEAGPRTHCGADP